MLFETWTFLLKKLVYAVQNLDISLKFWYSKQSVLCHEKTSVPDL